MSEEPSGGERSAPPASAPAGMLPDPLPIDRADGPLHGSVRVPGSKSITNRLLVLAALAEGRSVLGGALRSDDTDRLAEALRTLGVAIEQEGDRLEILGVGGRFPRGGKVDLGDGGTPARFMLALACLADGPVTVDGSPRLRERPMAEGIAFLRELGATITGLAGEDRLPVRVEGGARLRGGRLRVGATASSQFVSALMLIAPCLPEGLEIEYVAAPTSASYLSLTRATLRQFDVRVEDARFIGPRRDRIPHVRLRGREVDVEPDASSAVYWMAAAAIVPRSRVRLDGLAAGSPQPDIGMLEVLEHAGVRWTSTSSPRTLTIEGPGALRPFRMSLAHMPDGALAAAMVAARARGESVLSGLHTLRVKESDRLNGLANELSRCGVIADVRDESLVIQGDDGPGAAGPVVIDTARDHRMAMAFAVLGLARGGILIRDPGCVEKSYPGFWNDLARLCGHR